MLSLYDFSFKWPVAGLEEKGDATWRVQAVTIFWLVYFRICKADVWKWEFNTLINSYVIFFLPKFIFILIFIVFFFHYHLTPLYSPPPSNHHTVVHDYESFFLFAQSLHPIPHPVPLAVTLLFIYESVRPHFPCQFSLFILFHLA